MNANYKSIILAISLFLALSASVSAAPGDLDLSFGSGGIVVTDVASAWSDEVTDIEVQTDGKILVAGVLGDSFICEYPDCRDPDPLAFINRYLPTGVLDTSFGTGGKIIFPLSSGEVVNHIALQTDGKIVAVGYHYYQVIGNSNFIIFRFNADGTLDTSFGTGGKSTTNFATLSEGVVIQPDGKIVALAWGCNASGYCHSFGTIRFNVNGSLDTAFGAGGRVVTTVSSRNFPADVSLQPDGKIIIAGSAADNFSGFLDYAIVRYNSNGSLDASFGAGGIVSTDITQTDNPNAIALQPDGKILVNGNSGIVRYNANGSMDTGFAAGGIFTHGGGNSPIYDIALQRSGKIVAAGYVFQESHSVFALTRLNADGSRDASFGTNGNITTPIGNQYDSSYALAIQPNGKIISGGFTTQSDLFANVALVRYQGDAVASRHTPFDFDGDGRSDISVFRPINGVWYLNQSTNGFSATQFGLSADKITPADFDGDGKTDISVYRDGVWYWLKSSDNSFNARQFGIASDIPVPADYSGDGSAELAVYRNGVWWIQNLTNNQVNTIQFGISNDKPVPADYDGDGRIDQAIYRNGEWHLNRSSQGYTVVNFGLATDKPLIGDYDGDGRADQSVYRDGTWYLLQSSQGFTAFPFGLSTDIPAPADYDGDGRTDAAVYRNGTWYLRQSASGISIQQFGLTNDKPVSAAFLP